jgi:PIN domain nuclease of toxin-antitoxin system
VTLLLDTHAFLWFITDDPQLSAAAKSLIGDPDNEILVSPASYWETAIKVSIGKYPLSVPYETLIAQGIDGTGFKILAIEPRHAAALTTMPFHHRDPFDRNLVAQAQVENISLVSNHAILDRYGVKRLW